MKNIKDSIDIESMLNSVYEEVMWLADRPNTPPAAARSWYTHVVSNRLRRHIRKFTGMVSRRALEPNAVLRLEHFKRLQTTLTQLVADHHKRGVKDPQEFIRVVKECEQVHIVTFQENYDAMKSDGDYIKAGISLVNWKDITPAIQHELLKVLRGRVSNAEDFALEQKTPA